MVDADPEQRPAVVIGFSLGCKIAKYFLHFCNAKKGSDWMDSHIAHFVALGGPFRGSVALLRAMMIDGSFPPLDMMFTQSQMLTIMRGAPVGRYLQPTGNWADGMNLPFVYVRREKYIRVSFGPLKLTGAYSELPLQCQTSMKDLFTWQSCVWHMRCA